jgi:DnaJ-class molecular chaperone
VLERLDDGGPVDPSDLVEGPDLSNETKKRILRLHRRMRKLSPYELLGVAKDADGAAIKRAFGAASKELHPDRYFGKDLGNFREKLAKIFNRITEAMQELEKARKAKK